MGRSKLTPYYDDAVSTNDYKYKKNDFILSLFFYISQFK